MLDTSRINHRCSGVRARVLYTCGDGNHRARNSKVYEDVSKSVRKPFKRKGKVFENIEHGVSTPHTQPQVYGARQGNTRRRITPRVSFLLRLLAYSPGAFRCVCSTRTRVDNARRMYNVIFGVRSTVIVRAIYICRG